MTAKKKAEPKEADEKVGNKSVWQTLSAIDCSEHTEEKNGLTYLSWAWAWGILKTVYPDATFTKHQFASELPYANDVNGYAYVKVSVSVDGISSTELFPVLDYKNKAVQWPDAFQVNVAMQRGLTKAISYLGLGHYIYAGEDLPVPYDPNAVKQDLVGIDGSVKRADGLDMIVAVFKEFIGVIEDNQGLVGFWNTNKHAVKILKAKDEERYDDVVKFFSERKAEIEKKKDKK